MASPLPTLVCKECGYVNEGERVYCHNCGVKLDREGLILQEQQQAATFQKRQREVKKIMTPGRRNFAKTWRALWKTVALAAVVGALIDAARPPEGGVPGVQSEEMADPSQIASLLEGLVIAPAGKRIALREAVVNAYLKRERFKKLPDWFTNAIPLKALVNFDDGVGRLTFLANIAGYPICATFSGSLKTDKDAGLTATCTGGNIGRLQIPAQLASYAGGAIPTLLDSMKHERQLLGQLGFIEIGKKQILLGSRGPSVPTAAPVAPNGTVGRPAVP